MSISATDKAVEFCRVQINSWVVCPNLARWCMESRVLGVNLTIYILSVPFSVLRCGWQEICISEDGCANLPAQESQCLPFLLHSGCVILYNFFFCLWSQSDPLMRHVSLFNRQKIISFFLLAEWAELSHQTVGASTKEVVSTHSWDWEKGESWTIFLVVGSC